MVKIPTVTFNNGIKVPILGLGTWKSETNEVAEAVKTAIDIGYRHFDCARYYKNEKEVGQAITEKINSGTVKRDDLFITSKLWNTFHKPELVENSLKDTLKDLNLQYVDLYLIHWPMGYTDDDSFTETSDVDYVDTWKAMEGIYKKGLAKSIGVSNFNKKQIQRILDEGTVVPVTNQVECHPYLNQKRLVEFCKSKNITTTAYGPLGLPYRRTEKDQYISLLNHPKISEIAKKCSKTNAQILIKYQVQRGIITIPKSVKKLRLVENLDVFDFELTAEDMNAINGLDTNFRVVPFEQCVGNKDYPFHDEF